MATHTSAEPISAGMAVFGCAGTNTTFVWPRPFDVLDQVRLLLAVAHQAQPEIGQIGQELRRVDQRLEAVQHPQRAGVEDDERVVAAERPPRRAIRARRGEEIRVDAVRDERDALLGDAGGADVGHEAGRIDDHGRRAAAERLLEPAAEAADEAAAPALGLGDVIPEQVADLVDERHAVPPCGEVGRDALERRR